MFLENFDKLSKERQPGEKVWRGWSCADCGGRSLPLSLKIQQCTRLKSCLLTGVSFDFSMESCLCESVHFVHNQIANML